MDPLSVTASIIAILQLTTKVSEFLANAKDAPADRTQFTTEISNLSQLLITLLSHLDGDSNEPWNAKVRDLGGKDGILFQYRLALEQLKDKISDRSGMKNIGKIFLWRYIKDDVERILLRIERLKSIVQIALEMDHFKLSQAIENHINAIHSDSKAIKEGVGAIRQHQDRQQYHKITDWISPTNFPAQQSDFIAKRQEDTGLWFLDSPKFTEWVHGSNQSLFCPGIPGAGKTIMSAITVDHLHMKVRSHDIGLAYIFCNYKSRAEQNAVDLLAAILKQLVQARPSIPEPITRLYDQHANTKTRPSLEELLSALEHVLSSYSRAYLIVDAVDECFDHDREELLTKLRYLQSRIDLRLMATSRYIPNIVEDFIGTPTLEVRASSADVEQFVVGQISRLPRFVQRDDNLRGLIQSKIVEAVDGMFLLARLHIDSLLDKDTKKSIRSTLESLSRGTDALNKAYDGAIERIEAQLRGKVARAKSVLSWISYAGRPLTTGELCHALAVELEDEELDEDNIPDVEDIVSVCAGLVTVDEESNVVRLVHYTTQEYFEQIREKWIPDAQHEIASKCLTYLSFKHFRSGSCPNDAEFEIRLKQNIFLDYSSRYWGQHVLHVQEEVSELALYLLQDNNLVNCAIQTSHHPSYKYPNYSQKFPGQVTGLHLATSFGLLHCCKELLSRIAAESKFSADSKDRNGRTPLSWAAEQGHEAVVKLLVERDDVEVDSVDNYGRTPLSLAVVRGHEIIVKLLVERDDVGADSKDEDGRTPLSLAVVRGNETIVKLLVERDDVEADSKDNYGRTPLSWAAAQGHEAVVKLLVERDDVETDSKDNYGRTPLSWAAGRGREAVVKLLVDRNDVEADSKSKSCLTPLSLAARRGHEATVKLLVVRDDVEADSKSESGRTPLSLAAGRGHEAVIKLLVERGDVEADTKDKNGRTPLSWAAGRGHEAAVKLLVERDDVEADSKDENGRSPLSWAAEQGHEAVVKILAGRDDVEADSKSESGRKTLSFTSKEAHEAVIKLLKLKRNS